MVWFFLHYYYLKLIYMAADPNNKSNLDRSNDYDEDDRITNNEYPIREGQEDSSIRSNPAAGLEHLNEGGKQSIKGSSDAESEEYIGMYNDQTKKKED